MPNKHTQLLKDGEEPQGLRGRAPLRPLSTSKNSNQRFLSGAQLDSVTAELSSSSPATMAEAAREHVEKIRRERYYIGRGEQNPLAEDMHQAVNYLSQELYSKDVHFLMELVQVKNLAFLIRVLSYFFGTPFLY
jgi:sacsin